MIQNIRKLSITGSTAIPLIAALPYGITVDMDRGRLGHYDPETQLTRFARRDFSTCREDESVWSIFTSKSDTKKDD